MTGRLALAAALAAGGALAARRRRERLGDAVTDALFRRPSGPLARLWWRDPRPHHTNFTDVLDALTLRPADRLLDIGCGGGTFLCWALRSGCTAAGVDHSPDMVALAAANNRDAMRDGRLEVHQASAVQLPFADDELTQLLHTAGFTHITVQRRGRGLIQLATARRRG